MNATNFERHERSVPLIDAKRSFDLFLSAVALVTLAPVFLLISVAIRLTSEGPVFYRASRVGKDGKPFKMFKFRTMVVNADKIGPGITLDKDRRITPVGRVLRKTKLDELPQLINVLRGEMSMVGPRPEDPRYVALYTPHQRTVLSVRPGITSQASVHFRDESAQLSGPDWESHYVQVVMPAKLQLDIAYAQQPDVKRDLALIAKTILALFDR